VKIAVVGSGIAGISAALALAPDHEVTLYEREPVAGGHAHTVEVSTSAGSVPVDVGFIVYNDATYPTFSPMLAELGVATRPSDMSFGCRCAGCGLEYSTRGATGFFAQRRRLLDPGQWRLLLEIRAFFADARRFLAAGVGDDGTLGAYLQARPAASRLAGHFLLPLAAAVWSTSPTEVRRFPLLYLLRFLDHHGLIGFDRALRWRTVVGGSREYVSRALARLPRGAVRLGTAVVGVRSAHESAVDLLLEGGAVRRYEGIVLATHADTALGLLSNPSHAARRALAAFHYTTNRVVLHTDAGPVLPRLAGARASWNVRIDSCDARADRLTMTYDLTRLQSLPGDERILVSVNPAHVDPRLVRYEFSWAHPAYGSDTLAAQRAVERIQGEGRIWYAGAHLGYGFHEDGCRSGVAAARLVCGALAERAA